MELKSGSIVSFGSKEAKAKRLGFVSLETQPGLKFRHDGLQEFNDKMEFKLLSLFITNLNSQCMQHYKKNYYLIYIYKYLFFVNMKARIIRITSLASFKTDGSSSESGCMSAQWAVPGMTIAFSVLDTFFRTLKACQGSMRPAITNNYKQIIHLFILLINLIEKIYYYNWQS